MDETQNGQLKDAKKLLSPFHFVQPTRSRPGPIKQCAAQRGRLRILPLGFEQAVTTSPSDARARYKLASHVNIWAIPKWRLLAIAALLISIPN